MKLEGSLDAFSLEDLFHLLSFTRKSGGLHLRSGHADGVVWFVGGAVGGASADSTRQALARRLIGAGAVSDEALAAAVLRSAEGESIGVMRALLEANAVDESVVAQAGREQVVDAVFDLLRWTEGDFAFALDQHNPDAVGIMVPVEEVVAEATGRREVWKDVASVIPTPDTVLAMPPGLPEDVSLSPEEWSLLAFVDGKRTTAEIVDLVGTGAFVVGSGLMGLVRRGLLAVRDGEDHVTTVQRRQALLTSLEGETFQPTALLRQGGNTAAAAHEPHSETAPEDEAGVQVETPVEAPVEAPVEPKVEAPVEPKVETAAEPADETPSDQPDETPDETPPDVTPDEVVWDEPRVTDALLGGAHVPRNVVPARPEPFLPRRQAEFDDHDKHPAHLPAQVMNGTVDPARGSVEGSSAIAPQPSTSTLIERDPSVNRSLMLRLIAGVRGL